MKTKLSYLCGFLILFTAWCFYYTSDEQEKYANTAVPFLESALEDISQWRSDIMYSYLSMEAKQSINEEQLEQFLIRFKPLGKLERIAAPEFSRISSVLSIFSSSKKISYSTKVFFKNGSATMTATLTERGGVYKFYNFNLGSIQLYQ